MKKVTGFVKVGYGKYQVVPENLLDAKIIGAILFGQLEKFQDTIPMTVSPFKINDGTLYLKTCKDEIEGGCGVFTDKDNDELVVIIWFAKDSGIFEGKDYKIIIL